MLSIYTGLQLLFHLAGLQPGAYLHLLMGCTLLISILLFMAAFLFPFPLHGPGRRVRYGLGMDLLTCAFFSLLHFYVLNRSLSLLYVFIFYLFLSLPDQEKLYT